MRATLPSLLLLLVGLTPPTPARAHLVPPAGVTPFVEGGALVGGGTTWGVILRDGDGAFRRVCEEALGIPTAFLRAADGRVLIGRAERGLIVTSDGCRHEVLEGPLEGHAVSALAAVPADPDRVFATTATTGLENGVFVSDDGGRTFAPTSLARAGQLFYQLLVGDDGQLVAAAGLDTTSQQTVLAVSTDGGATFAAPAADLDAYAFLRLLAVDDAGALMLGAVDDQGQNHLLRSADGLATVEVVASFDGPALGFAEAGGQRFVLVRSQADGKGIYRQPAGGGAFVRVEGGPQACLLNVPGDDRLWGCGEDGQEGHFFVSDDGERWQPLVPFDAVEERCCGEEDPGTLQCLAYLAGTDGGPPVCSNVPLLDGGSGGPGVRSERPSECACVATSTTPSPWGLLGLVGLGALWWRRRVTDL